MGDQQTGRLQREAHPGQHQLRASDCQQVLLAEWFPLDLQHPTEANRDPNARGQQDEMLTAVFAVYRR